MGQEAEHIYQSRIKSFEVEVERIKKRNTRYSLIRLLSFIAAIILLIKLLPLNLYLAIGTAMVAFSVRVLLINGSPAL